MTFNANLNLNDTQMTTVKSKYIGELRTSSIHVKSGAEITTDAPTDNNGKGEAFSPTDLLATALGSCAVTIMGLCALKNNFDIGIPSFNIEKTMATSPRRVAKLKVEISFAKPRFTEQQKQIMEIIPKIGNTTNNTNCHNTTNKFNMNFFLNETCKDAIPLVEFINNLKLTVEDLDNTGKEGLVKGLTDIITKGLNELDITERPIHCSDIKRETLYIKNEDKWIKDDKDKTIVADAIGKVKREADSFFPQWLEEHPLCWKRDSPYHEQYMTMVTNRFGKGDENFVEKNTKRVIKNIAKEVIVDKDTNEIE